VAGVVNVDDLPERVSPPSAVEGLCGEVGLSFREPALAAALARNSGEIPYE